MITAFPTLARSCPVLLLMASLCSASSASVEASASHPQADATTEFARSNNRH